MLPSPNNRSMRAPSFSLSSETCRFLAVGIAVAALQATTSYALLTIGVDPAASAALAFAFAFVTAYGIHRIWTFAGSPLPSHPRALVRYGLTQVISMLAAVMVAHALALAHTSSLVVAGLSTATAGGLSWLLSSRWVFRQ